MGSLLPRFNLTVSRFFSSPSFPYIKERPSYIYHPCIHIIQSCPSPKHLLQVHSHLTTLGIFRLWSPRLLQRASDFGDFTYSVSLLNCVDSPGIFCVNNALRACSLGSDPDEAVALYFGTVGFGNFHPNTYTFVFLINSCAKMGCLSSGKKSHAQVVKYGVCSALPVQNSLIHMYSSCGSLEFVRKVFDEMTVKDLVSWNSVLSGYVNVGELVAAHELFDAMSERNVVSWNIMISGYLKENNPGCALMVFRKMITAGIMTSERTLSSAATACGRSNRLKEGRSVHGYALRLSNVANHFVCTSLVDMYCKCGKLESAERIFKMMKTKSLVTWNAMILGQCIQGNPEEGLKLFSQMTPERTPDESTFIGVLCACCRLNILSEGKRVFAEMKGKYGVKPNFAHYWLLAHLHAVCGMVEDAENHLRKYDNSSSMVNLFAVGRYHGEVEDAERVARCYNEGITSKFSQYLFLANIYAAAGKWEDVSRVKNVVKKLGARRIPGVALHDLKHVVEDYKL